MRNGNPIKKEKESMEHFRVKQINALSSQPYSSRLLDFNRHTLNPNLKFKKIKSNICITLQEWSYGDNVVPN
jgi:hypothetical protein